MSTAALSPEELTLQDVIELVGDKERDLLERAANELRKRGGFKQLDESLNARFEVRRREHLARSATYIGPDENGGVKGNIPLQEFMRRMVNAMRLVAVATIIRDESTTRLADNDRMKIQTIDAIVVRANDPRLGIFDDGPFVAAHNKTLQSKLLVPGRLPPGTRKKNIEAGTIPNEERLYDIVGLIMMQAVESFRDNKVYRDGAISFPSRIPRG